MTMTRRSRQVAFLCTVTPCLVAVAIAAVVLGSTHVDFEASARVIGSKFFPFWISADRVPEADAVIIWLIRIPRLLVAAAVGAGLAMAGAMTQGIFRNALADPNVVGVGAGSALGSVIVFSSGLYAKSVWALPAGGFAGGLLALAALYAVSTRGGVTRISALLLGGIALALVLGSITMLLLSLNAANSELAEEILFWMMGGLHNRSWIHVWLSAPLILIAMAAAVVYARDLDLLIQGEETAATLGVEVESSKKRIMLICALLTGSAVAVAGPVGFVGLIVPHMVRLFVGPSHRSLLPSSALAGAAFIITCDMLSRFIHPPTEIRLGIITAAFGTPFFLLLLIRKHRDIQP
jgi:iron complex transport system permease protein